jgi:hypothetical protein
MSMMLCNFYFVINSKIADYSTTTEAREKIKTVMQPLSYEIFMGV